MESAFLKGVYLTVISARRPGNVMPMSKLIGPATWVVPRGQKQLYRNHGAPNVVEDGDGLVGARNAALRLAWAKGLPCCQLDDDLRTIKRAIPARQAGGKTTAIKIGFKPAVQLMLKALAGHKAKMAGVACTDNPFFYPGRAVSLDKFIIASWILVQPCDLFFDAKFALKEDYDYTLQHLAKYGQVCRCDEVLPSFLHYTNPGGVQDVRTPDLEQASIRQLQERWGDAIRPHPRRDNEVLLKWKGRPAAKA